MALLKYCLKRIKKKNKKRYRNLLFSFIKLHLSLSKMVGLTHPDKHFLSKKLENIDDEEDDPDYTDGSNDTYDSYDSDDSSYSNDSDGINDTDTKKQASLVSKYIDAQIDYHIFTKLDKKEKIRLKEQSISFYTNLKSITV